MKGLVTPAAVTCCGDHLETDTGTLIGVLEVVSTSLETQTEAEAAAVHQAYQRLLETIDYPVHLHSRQSHVDLDAHCAQLAGDDPCGLATEYVNYCHRLAAQGLTQTRHYVVIGVPAGDAALTTLSTRVQTVAERLQPLTLGVTHLVDAELEAFRCDVINQDPEPTRTDVATVTEGFDEYRRLIYIATYPRTLRFGWPIKLLQLDGLVDVTQVLRPLETAQAVKWLRFHAERLEAEITALLAGGRRGVHTLTRAVEDADWFLDLLAGGEARPYRYGVYVTAHSTDTATVEQTLAAVRATLEATGVTVGEPYYRNDWAYETDSPLHGDRLAETLLVPSSSAAAGFPFGTQHFTQEGVLYGRDAQDGTPIILDRFAWDSHSMVVMGALGSGKSYATKLELLRASLVYPDLRIIVLDPKQEYSRLIRTLGGEHRIAFPGETYDLDQSVLGFEVATRGEQASIEGLLSVLEQLYAAVSQKPQRTIFVVDEAHNLLREPAGRRLLQKLVLEARDLSMALHLVSQSAAHFTDWPEGRDILAHVPGKLFFRHEQVSESMIEYFDGAGDTQYSLRTLPTGGDIGYSEAILQVSNWLETRLQIEATPTEHRLARSTQAEQALRRLS